MAIRCSGRPIADLFRVRVHPAHDRRARRHSRTPARWTCTGRRIGRLHVAARGARTIDVDGVRLVRVRPATADRRLQSGDTTRTSIARTRARRPRPSTHQEPDPDMISTGELQEGRRHRARRRALADPRLPPHQDGPRLGPGPDHAAQHQARPDGRALVPGRDEVAARVDGEAPRPVPVPRRRRLPLHGQRHVRPVRADARTSSARRPST